MRNKIFVLAFISCFSVLSADVATNQPCQLQEVFTKGCAVSIGSAFIAGLLEQYSQQAYVKDQQALQRYAEEQFMEEQVRLLDIPAFTALLKMRSKGIIAYRAQEISDREYSEIIKTVQDLLECYVKRAFAEVGQEMEKLRLQCNIEEHDFKTLLVDRIKLEKDLLAIQAKKHMQERGFILE